MLFASFDPNLLMPVLALIAVAAIIYGAYRHYERTRPKTYCPNCGGEMTPDAEKYRYTIEWTCHDCGETFEQLRNDR